MASFFHPNLISTPSTTSFTPLFRLLEDFDSYSQHQSGTDSELNPGNKGSQRHGNLRHKTFSPKFDVKELPDHYELHGELPGIEQNDVEIEFVNEGTLTVRGRVEREYSSGSPAQAIMEAGGHANGAHAKSHQPTVEDEGAVSKSSSKSSEVAKSTNQHKVPEAKYWVSERSIGEFSRSFSFPARVDQEGVKASMKNGILKILVPKAKKMATKRISIE